MWPLVCLSNETEVEDLQKAGVWVAGFKDDPRALSDSFDVLCDLNIGRVLVNDHAKDAFVMGSYHKDVLQALTAACAQGDDQNAVKELLSKSKALVAQVQSYSTGGPVTMDTLREKQLPPHMDRFLFLIAQAEGI
jgi:hypothetical protein